MLRRATPLILLLALACSPAQKAREETPKAAPQSAGTVHVYVSDRYDGVYRLDPGTLEVLGKIETGRRPHGLVASPDGRWLYITVETTNELLKVDTGTDQIVARAKVGPVPNEPTITRNGRFVVVPQRGGDQCDVVDTEKMKVVRSLPAGKAEHNTYTSQDGRHIYVTSMGDRKITVIDTATWKIAHTIPLPGIPRPLALTRREDRGYLALSGLNGFVVLDLKARKVTHRVTLPVPEGTPVPPLDTYTHGMLLTPDETELWVASYATHKVYAFALPGLKPLAEIPVPGGPHWFTLHPDGEPLYVTLESSGQVAAIHRGLRQVLRTAPVSRAPTRILAFP